MKNYEDMHCKALSLCVPFTEYTQDASTAKYKLSVDQHSPGSYFQSYTRVQYAHLCSNKRHYTSDITEDAHTNTNRQPWWCELQVSPTRSVHQTSHTVQLQHLSPRASHMQRVSVPTQQWQTKPDLLANNIQTSHTDWGNPIVTKTDAERKKVTEFRRSSCSLDQWNIYHPSNTLCW